MQTLYTYPDNFRAYKALIAAKYSGASVKTDPKFVFGETNKSKQFLAKFPFGKVGEQEHPVRFRDVSSSFSFPNFIPILHSTNPVDSQ